MLKDSGLLAVSSGAGSLEKIRPWSKRLVVQQILYVCRHVVTNLVGKVAHTAELDLSDLHVPSLTCKLKGTQQLEQARLTIFSQHTEKELLLAQF
jgi:hypothetical protein